MRIDSFGHFSGGRSGGTEPPRARDGVLARAVTERPTGDGAPRDGAPREAAARERAGREPAPRDRPVRRPAIEAPSGLVVLTLAAPVLAVALLMVGLPRETSLLVMASWSLVQVPLLMVALERRLHGGSADEQSTPDVDNRTGDDAVEIDPDRAKDRLHEVRATVAGIGLTHRLLSDEQVPISGADRSRLEHLYDREIARLERLLQDDDGPDHQDVDVQSAVDPVVESLRVRGHRVAWEGTEALAIGRPDDIAEIVHILLANAARHAPGADVSVWVESSPTRLLLRVSDNGPGVPSALAPRLFERGIRGPESPGEGIGLNIARRLAREMGGDLVLEPASTRSGATFTVVLRASAETAPCLVRQR
jgi:signal transduction histidine kinase